MAVNLWFEHIIDAYLRACVAGRDWQIECAAAEQAIGDEPRRVLTQADLKKKGIAYSRQHVARRVRNRTFPPPFQLPDNSPT